MKFAISRKWTRILPIVVVMTAYSTLTFNCAPSMFKSASSTANLSSLSECGTADCFGKPKSPYTMMTSHQIFSGMLNVTELNNSVSANMRAAYDERKGSLADNDNIAGVNAPLQLSATGVAGEICNTVLTREQALQIGSRRFFNEVDFTRNLAQNTSASYAQAIEGMARAFWGRPLKSEESQILNEYYADFVASFGSAGASADQVRTTRKLYLSVCSAMLSSFDAIVN